MYRTIDGAFWTDPKVKKLDTADKLLFLYFITNPLARLSGLYCISLPVICHETKLNERAARKGMDTLSAIGVIEYDDECEVVWVVNMLGHQTGNKHINAKIAAAVAKDLTKAHKSCLILHFLERYHTLSIPYVYPTDRGTHSESGEWRVDTDTESGPETAANAAPAANAASTIPTPFSSIVDQWNAVCGAAGCPSVRTTTEARKAKMRTRWKQDGFQEGYPEVLSIIAKTDFLRGGCKQGWKATFDWLIDNDKNWVKVLEGNYNDPDTSLFSKADGDSSSQPFQSRNATPEEEAIMRADFNALPDADKLRSLLREVKGLKHDDDRKRCQAEIDRLRKVLTGD